MKRSGARIEKINIIIILFLLLFVVISSGFRGIKRSYAYVATATATEYSSVLDDLQKDENFKETDYLPDGTSSEIELITIAEGSGKELFLYVYNPSGREETRTTYINISRSESGKGYSRYKTEYINGDGVFEKYKVKNFTVKSDAVRYYDITAIYRAFIEGTDKASSITVNSITENGVSNISYAVGRLYIAVTSNGNVTYTCIEEEVIIITDKLCGTMRYKDGVGYGWAVTDYATDSHFVAFSTDHSIDKLLEADVTYTYKTYTASGLALSLLWSEAEYEYGNAVTGNEVTVTYTEKSTSIEHGVFRHTYEWPRIQTGAEFAKEAGDSLFSDSTLEEIAGKEWVLRFCETEFSVSLSAIGGILGTYDVSGTRVSDVSILRLKFETDGNVYNLGVVDNIQSGGLVGVDSTFDPVEEIVEDTVNSFVNFLGVLLTVVGIIAAVALLVVFWNPITTVLKGIGNIIAYPFKRLSEKIKESKKKKKESGETKGSKKKNGKAKEKGKQKQK